MPKRTRIRRVAGANRSAALRPRAATPRSSTTSVLLVHLDSSTNRRRPGRDHRGECSAAAAFDSVRRFGSLLPSRDCTGRGSARRPRGPASASLVKQTRPTSARSADIRQAGPASRPRRCSLSVPVAGRSSAVTSTAALRASGVVGVRARDRARFRTQPSPACAPSRPPCARRRPLVDSRASKIASIRTSG
jgi:hypothetical protein